MERIWRMFKEGESSMKNLTCESRSSDSWIIMNSASSDAARADAPQGTVDSALMMRSRISSRAISSEKKPTTCPAFDAWRAMSSASDVLPTDGRAPRMMSSDFAGRTGCCRFRRSRSGDAAQLVAAGVEVFHGASTAAGSSFLQCEEILPAWTSAKSKGSSAARRYPGGLLRSGPAGRRPR